MLFLFAPMLEGQLQLFKFRNLSGVYRKAQKPELSFDKYKDGTWQKQAEAYVSENFGFRIPVIRLYNQYLYDFFNKTFNKEVAIGKDGWLYQQDGVNQYFGLMNRRYGYSNEKFQSNLDCEIRSLQKIRAILKEYDVELMTFTLPVKSFVYPEHLRMQHYEDTLFDAGAYYDSQLREANFPHIDMTPWFQKIRDDYPFTLFHEKGSHWASGAVIATDSLLRFMETLKGDHLARIKMGTPYPVPEDQIVKQDIDLAYLLNTLWIPKQRLPFYEIPVTIETDSSTVLPTALFIGTSYFWYITPRVPLEKVFSDRDFIFYNTTYYTDEEATLIDLKEKNWLRELLLHDYVVYFKNAPQLYFDGFHFYGNALISLCISEQRFNEKIEEVTDSLMLVHDDPANKQQRGNFRYKAKNLLLNNPELFEELRGSDVPTSRNPKINNILVERKIHNDRTWSFLLECHAIYDSLTLDKVYEMEAKNILDGMPLLKNSTYFSTYDYFNFIVEETIDEMRRRPDITDSRKSLRSAAWAQIDSLIDQHAFDNDSLMQMACSMNLIIQRLETKKSLEALRKKAQERNLSLDKMFHNDVVWIFKNRDLNTIIDSSTIKEFFENYKIEYGFRSKKESMDNIRQKAKENDIPLRLAINRDIKWCLNNKK